MRPTPPAVWSLHRTSSRTRLLCFAYEAPLLPTHIPQGYLVQAPGPYADVLRRLRVGAPLVGHSLGRGTRCARASCAFAASPDSDSTGRSRCQNMLDTLAAAAPAPCCAMHRKRPAPLLEHHRLQSRLGMSYSPYSNPLCHRAVHRWPASSRIVTLFNDRAALINYSRCVCVCGQDSTASRRHLPLIPAADYAHRSNLDSTPSLQSLSVSHASSARSDLYRQVQNSPLQAPTAPDSS